MTFRCHSIIASLRIGMAWLVTEQAFRYRGESFVFEFLSFFFGVFG